MRFSKTFGKRRFIVRDNNKVNMICHQTPGENFNLAALCFFLYKLQIGSSIAIAFKNIHRSYTTLCNVMWVSDCYYSRYSGHGELFRQLCCLFQEKYVLCPYAVTTAYSSGLKSRPGSYPLTPVVQGSGVGAIWGRKFPIGKPAGRNASEPTGSLVKLIWRCRPCGQKGKAEVQRREQRRWPERSLGVAGSACWRR